MAASGPRLTPEQREVLLTWLAADYSTELIRHWLEERGWPVISRQAIHQHREQFEPDIERMRQERHSRALTTGTALKEERVQRLKDHLDKLEEIKWVPDKNGKLWNEKGWRETLDDIAREMGHRRIGIDADVGNKSDAELIEEATRTLQGARAAGSDSPGS